MKRKLDRLAGFVAARDAETCIGVTNVCSKARAKIETRLIHIATPMRRTAAAGQKMAECRNGFRRVTVTLSVCDVEIKTGRDRNSTESP